LFIVCRTVADADENLTKNWMYWRSLL